MQDNPQPQEPVPSPDPEHEPPQSIQPPSHSPSPSEQSLITLTILSRTTENQNEEGEREGEGEGEGAQPKDIDLDHHDDDGSLGLLKNEVLPDSVGLIVLISISLFVIVTNYVFIIHPIVSALRFPLNKSVSHTSSSSLETGSYSHREDPPQNPPIVDHQAKEQSIELSHLSASSTSSPFSSQLSSPTHHAHNTSGDDHLDLESEYDRQVSRLNRIITDYSNLRLQSRFNFKDPKVKVTKKDLLSS